jgi:N-acetylglucosaminyldiphosphoundecaprenol N-acetyl-beta-D-mannosaminyltransferase
MQAADEVERAIDCGSALDHVSINAAKIVQFQSDESLRQAVWSYGLSTADGQPVVWAARLLGHPVPERVAGIDLMNVLLERAADRGRRIYLLGARPDVLSRAAAEIMRRYPGIVLAGTQHGYYEPSDEPSVVAAVARARPDMLFVALATPQKELFLARSRGALGVPFAMGVGGAFDVLAGVRRRAPAWTQRMGLEWAVRLGQEPRRLAWRYLDGNARFVYLVLSELVRTRLGGRAAGGRRP